jgi:hypothetical protein
MDGHILAASRYPLSCARGLNHSGAEARRSRGSATARFLSLSSG